MRRWESQFKPTFKVRLVQNATMLKHCSSIATALGKFVQVFGCNVGAFWLVSSWRAHFVTSCCLKVYILSLNDFPVSFNAGNFWMLIGSQYEPLLLLDHWLDDLTNNFVFICFLFNLLYWFTCFIPDLEFFVPLELVQILRLCVHLIHFYSSLAWTSGLHVQLFLLWAHLFEEILFFDNFSLFLFGCMVILFID